MKKQKTVQPPKQAPNIPPGKVSTDVAKRNGQRDLTKTKTARDPSKAR